MAIVVLQEPPLELLASEINNGTLPYQVVIGIVSVSSTRPAVDPVLNVLVEINGSIINGEGDAPDGAVYSLVGTGPYTHTYTFDFDIQQNIQDYFGEDVLLFRELFHPTQVTQADGAWMARFRLALYEWLPDADGLLVENPVPVYTGYRDAIDAYIRFTDPQSLQEYDRTITAPAKFLTEKTDLQRKVYRTDDEQIAVCYAGTAMDIAGITYRAYNKAGTLLAIGAITIPASQSGITVIGVGPQNIVAATGWSITPTHLPNNPLVAYYEIFMSGAIPTLTETIRFYLLDECRRTQRIYFKNRFGAYDTIDVEDADVEKYATESSSFSRHRSPATYSRTARGRNRLQTTGKRSWDGYKFAYPKQDAEFYAQFLLSTNVYLVDFDHPEFDPNLVFYFVIPVVVKDTEVDIVNNVEGDYVELKFTLEAANLDKTQRN